MKRRVGYGVWRRSERRFTGRRVTHVLYAWRDCLGRLDSPAETRLRFPGHPQAQPSTPVRREVYSERHAGTSATVSPQGFTPGSPQKLSRG